MRFSSTILFASTADATVSNTVTETSLVGSGRGSLTLPANFFAVGKSVRIVARGYISTTAANVTLTIKLKYGTTVINTSSALSISSLTNSSFIVDAIVTCRTTGATGTVMPQAEARAYLNNIQFETWLMAATSTVTVDTTTSNMIDVTATWGTANVSNSVSITNLIAESIEI